MKSRRLLLIASSESCMLIHLHSRIDIPSWSFCGLLPVDLYTTKSQINPVKSRRLILKKFGQTLRLERRKQGLSQEEFAHIAGIDRSYVGAVERGEQNPSLWTIARLANALELPIGSLFESIDSR
ncbi:MAG: helix-turn-helix domain-containing protein [Candidatus Obscuribacterales bacterium]